MVNHLEKQFSHKLFLKNLSNRPGVYSMLNKKNKIIYVGKAQSLKKRLSSYFRKTQIDKKISFMMGQVTNIELTITNTENEALILEYNLIKRHKPRFNVVLRDGKSYPYIHITTDQNFPQLQFYRGKTNKNGKYFGPFPNTSAARKSIGELQKLFLIRQCDDSTFKNRSRPCLQYQLKRCSAPCVNLITQEEYLKDVDASLLFLEGKSKKVISYLIERMDIFSEKKEYEKAAKIRDQIKRFKGIEAEQLVSEISSVNLDILGIASEFNMHCVAILSVRNGKVLGTRYYFPKISGGPGKDKIQHGFLSQHYVNEKNAPSEIIVEYNVQGREILEENLSTHSGHKVKIKNHTRARRKKWLDLAKTNANQGLKIELAKKTKINVQLSELGKILDIKGNVTRLECFDVSHTSGEFTVASCVVFDQEGAKKNEYRRFNIKNNIPGDDYSAMSEAIRRHYIRLKKNRSKLPDVLFVDGGKGQLSRTLLVLDQIGLKNLNVVAIAKNKSRKSGSEKLFMPNISKPLILPYDSLAKLLIQNIRDEAHRFAISGHRLKRAKKIKQSQLERIPGLGPKRRRDLLREFGGLEGIMKAGISDLSKVQGISKLMSERVYNNLHDYQ